MKWTRVFVLMLVPVVAASGCKGTAAKGLSEYSSPNREMTALEAKPAPKIDGKLDDACWQAATPLTGFVKLMKGAPAAYESFAYLCYDDSHLYVGMKCLMPKGKKPKGEARGHDGSKLFADDIVEIMIDPGRSRENYYQLVMSAYGATFDCSRTAAGKVEDDAWNGDWQGKAHVADGYWSTEMAVPFHNLGITPDVGSTWGMNFCRESPTAGELTSLGADAMFNNAEAFVIVKGVKVNFSKYLFSIGPEEVVIEGDAAEPRAALMVPVKNLSGKARKVKIERHFTGADGQEDVETRVVDLGKGKAVTLRAEDMTFEPMRPKTRDMMKLRPITKTNKIVVSDATDGTILSLSMTRRPSYHAAMRVEAVDPWEKKISRRKSDAVRLSVVTDLPRETLKKGALEVTLVSRETGKEVARRTITGPSVRQKVTFKTKDIPWGAYRADAAFRNAAGRAFLNASARTTVLPGDPYHIKPMNNLVSELVNARERGMLREKELVFMNPRDGWIYVKVTSNIRRDGKLSVSVDGQAKVPDILVLRGKPGETSEAMRSLPAGRHTLVLASDGPCDIENVIVRAIPEIVYSRYGANPHTRPFGPFGGEFERKYIHPNINVLVTSGATLDKDPFAKAWVGRGKKWLLHCGVPKENIAGKLAGVNVGKPDAQGETTPLTPEDAAGFISDSAGFKHPLAKGSIADEFGNSAAYCEPYALGVWRLSEMAGHSEKKFYPYANHLYDGAEGRLLMQALADAGSKIAWKRYLKTRPTERLARVFLKEELLDRATQYRELCPGSLESIVVCFGNFSAPNEFLNVNPNVNYRKHLDMMFNIVANEGVFWRTYGIMSYLSAYADEESNRWTAHLFRHYGIEGRTEPATDEPYEMRHLVNSDFEEGLRGWDVRPAEEGSVRAVERPGFGWLQGRYPRTEEGDKALLAVRSAKRPNVFSQVIENLEPGKLYSFRMFSADFESMGKREQNAVTVTLDNVELVPKHSFDYPIANCYSHAYPPYDKENKAWMNYHWRIFLAKGRTAKVTVTDWAGEGKPGGRIGQQLIFNYCMVQPYYAPQE